MNYTRWPERGCSLREAAARISPAGRLSATSSRRLQEALVQGRLVGIGKADGEDGASVISADSWSEMDIDAEFAVTDRGHGRRLREVTVWPALRAETCLERLDGMPLATAFAELVLGDPEIRVLGAEAARTDESFAGVMEGAFGPVGRFEWDVAPPIHLPGVPDGKSPIGLLERSPDSLLAAADAVVDRYEALLAPLRNGDIEAVGLLRDGLVPVPRSFWSSPAFCLAVHSGDLLEKGPSESDPLRRVRRWTGLQLHRPATHATKGPVKVAVISRHRRKAEAVERALAEHGIDLRGARCRWPRSARRSGPACHGGCLQLRRRMHWRRC